MGKLRRPRRPKEEARTRLRGQVSNAKQTASPTQSRSSDRRLAHRPDAAESLSLKRTIAAWGTEVPGLVTLAVLWAILVGQTFSHRIPRPIDWALGLLAAALSYFLSQPLELPLERWYRLGPVRGTRLDRPVGILPSGCDLDTARNKAIAVFTAEGYRWPNYIGSGVYALSKARLLRRDPQTWFRRLQPQVSLNKFLRAMVIPFLFAAAAAVYLWVVPEALIDLSLASDMRHVPGSLPLVVALIAVLIAFGFFLGFVHIKITHMTSVYDAVYGLA